MYKIDDYVIYNQLCVCKIVCEEQMYLEAFGTKTYYKLCPVFKDQQNTFYYVPVDSTNNLRPITTKETPLIILKNFCNERVTVSSLKKPLLLTSYYKERFNNAGLKECLTLLKEIFIKGAKNKKKLNETDLKYYSKAERLVVEELSVIFNEDKEKTKQMVNDLINK